MAAQQALEEHVVTVRTQHVVVAPKAADGRVGASQRPAEHGLSRTRSTREGERGSLQGFFNRHGARRGKGRATRFGIATVGMWGGSSEFSQWRVHVASARHG